MAELFREKGKLERIRFRRQRKAFATNAWSQYQETQVVMSGSSSARWLQERFT